MWLVIAIALVILILVPDPLPFIDEIALTVGALASVVKVLTPSNNKKGKKSSKKNDIIDVDDN